MKEYKQNPVVEKSYILALNIIKLYRDLLKPQHEYVLGKQILRSGTSIGANVEEAQGTQTDKDFQYKMAIAYKEARETEYWLRLLHDSDIIDSKTFTQLHDKLVELLKILGSIQKTMKLSTQS